MDKGLSGLLRNYLKIGFRSLHRYRPYSLINLLGLIIGLSSVFCIIVYLSGERSYDRFHENGDQLYRVNGIFTRTSGDIKYPLVPPAFGPAIRENHPEVQRATRLRYAYNVLMQHEDRSFYEDRVFFAEADFLEMFTFQAIEGDPIASLKEVNTIILTKQMAIKYFGSQNPIGQSITYNEEINLKVGAIIEDVPEHSHFTFDFLISFETFTPGPGSLADLTSWRWLGFLTYLQLHEQTDVSALEDKLAVLYRNNSTSNPNREIHIQLQPLQEIYLGSAELSNPMGGLFKINDYKNLLSLGIIALLIIIIAFFNYQNIITALMRTRAREMGVRKVFGSSRMKIIGQLSIETAVVVGISGTLSIVVLFTLSQLGIVAPIPLATYLWILVIMAAICVLFSLVSGFYLGSLLSGYGTLSLLHNQLGQKTTKVSFRHIVLFLQYGISAALITISLIVIAQINFFNKKELGYDKSGILVVPFRGENAMSKMEPLRNALGSNSEVKAVSFGPSLDGSTSGNPLRLREWPEDQVVQTAYFGVDYDFKDLLDLELVDGRFFSETVQSDSTEAIMINETLAEALELDDPLQQKVIFTGEQEYEIIGVFSDFHYQSLHHEIGPLALKIWSGPPRNMLIRLEGNDIGEALNTVGASWKTIFPNMESPFQYEFLDDQIASMYSTEKDFALRLQLFTALAIFIALLGLFGLSAITIHLKLRQISIRRVLGASLLDVFKLIGQNFLLIALIASLVSWPLVIFFMKRWLEDFAYRINIDVSFLLQSLLLVGMVTFITIAIQMRRVTKSNPAAILKNDH